MDTYKIINAAMANAETARKQGVKSVKLPALGFEEWAGLFKREDNLAGREEHRAHQKRAYYFRKFLEDSDIEVTIITCRADDIERWAEENGHPLDSDGDRFHVLAHYVNQSGIPLTQCVHQRPLTAGMASSGIELYGTITSFGEGPEHPEILSTVVHTRDGWVVESLEVLAAKHTTREAFGMSMELLKKHGVSNVFHDPTVRRPVFCSGCNELLVNVAGAGEYDRLDEEQETVYH